MALQVNSLRRIIRDNGHLVLTGEETRNDLVEAITNLFTETNCRIRYGTPIGELTSLTAVKVERTVRKRRVTATSDS